jgi:resuscitation-promoting factor RpfA
MAAKSPDAFRTISEVADWLDRPAHVLRFWESKFPQVKPVKRAGGRRYYRPDDMLLLGGIKKLLHDDGMTIKGVQKIIREQGVKYVSGMSQPLDEVTAGAGTETAVAETATARTSPPRTDSGAARPVMTPSPSYPSDTAATSDAGRAAPPASAPTLQIVPDAAPAAPIAPAPPLEDSAVPQERTLPADEPAAAPIPPVTPPPAAAEIPDMAPLPQDAPPVAARAPLGADLPPPPDMDAIRTEPGLLALLAARRHGITGSERDALTPILAQIDALTTRLVTARKG